MSDYQSNKKGEWDAAHEARKTEKAEKTIAEIKQMLADTPDARPKVDEPVCKICTSFRMSRQFQNVRECNDCGAFMEGYTEV